MYHYLVSLAASWVNIMDEDGYSDDDGFSPLVRTRLSWLDNAVFPSRGMTAMEVSYCLLVEYLTCIWVFETSATPSQEVDSTDESNSDDLEVALENAYFQAKAEKDENPGEALSGFLQVLALEERRGEWGFKALKQMMKMHFRRVCMCGGRVCMCEGRVYTCEGRVCTLYVWGDDVYA